MVSAKQLTNRYRQVFTIHFGLIFEGGESFQVHFLIDQICMLLTIFFVIMKKYSQLKLFS